MALLFMDGFDHYATADILKKWDSLSGSGTISTSLGRRGSGCLEMISTGRWIEKNVGGNYQTLIVGLAATYSGAVSTTSIVTFYDGATAQCFVAIEQDGRLGAYNAAGSTLLGKSTVSVPFTGGYSYIEVKATISNSAGVVVVRLNGVEVLNLTSQDTQVSANAFSTRVRFTGNSGTRFDDLYIADTSGSAPQNDFLGDVRIDTVLPNANGNYSQFDGSDGNSTDNYLLVDEATPNTSDYTSSDVAAEKDSYQHAAVAALTSQTIFGVQVNAAALKDDAGARSLKVGVRSGTTDSVDAGTALSTSQLYYRNIFPTDPNTAAAWTETNVNAVESLVEIA